MARKKKHEEHENHERWLVSYADFITLLFAFFVVMYSVSSVNEGKYRVLSSSIVTAFHRPIKSLEPIQIGTPSKDISSRVILRSTRPITVEIPGIPGSRTGEEDSGKEKEKEKKKKDDDSDDLKKTRGLRSSGVVMRKIGEDLEKALSSLVDQGLVSVSKSAQRVEVEIKSSVLFQSGSATISLDAIPVLEKVGSLLTPFPNEVLVEGYTDNIPISNMIYPSNWELSAARSASVVHLFMKTGIDPARMTATGYAEYRPIAGNDTEEGRSKNRRVVLVIPAKEKAKDIVEALTSSGIDIGGRGPKEKDKQTEEPLISNIKLMRDSLPVMEVSPSEVIAPVVKKSDLSKGDASKTEDTTTKQATGKMMGEKPGVFPVTISPFQLPVLPALKGFVEKNQAVIEKPEIEKSGSEKERLTNKPRIKGKIKTIQQSDENTIRVEREIKLQRETDLGRETQPQAVIIREPIDKIEAQPKSKKGSQQKNKGATEGNAQKGTFPVFNLPVLPGLEGIADNIKEPAKPVKSKGRSVGGSANKPVVRQRPKGKMPEKEVRSPVRRKVILDRVTAPSYESKPQAVSVPQQTDGEQQKESGEKASRKDGKPVKNQADQNLRQETQRPRVIAPPIQLPFRKIVPDANDTTVDTTSRGSKPTRERQ